MTQESPTVQSCLVTVVGNVHDPALAGWPRVPLIEAVAGIRAGSLDRALVEDGRSGAMLLEAGASARHRAASALVELRGLALTTRAADTDDPTDLQPARAIRRALADGRMSAREVGYAAVEAVGLDAGERAAHAVVRGLGRFASACALDIGDGAGPGAGARCVRAIADGAASGAVALSLGADGVNVALAFSRPR